MKTLRKLFLLAALLCPITAAGYAQTYWDGTFSRDWTGSGTEADPFVITTSQQLAGFAQYVNEGNTCKGLYFVLGADIYLTDPNADSATKKKTEWVPIGRWWNAGDDTPEGIDFRQEYFKGCFDGKGYTIHNLYHATTPGESYFDNPDDPLDVGVIDTKGWNKALFGSIDSASIKNLTLHDVNMMGAAGMAGLAVKLSYSTITNCHVTGNSNIVSWYKKIEGGAGGLVYEVENSLVENSSSEANVEGPRGAGSLVGGNLEGGVIRNCHAEGNAHCTQYYAGGLVGRNDGLIEKSYSSGNVSRSYDSYAWNSPTPDCAGFVGTNTEKGVIRECYSTGNVNSPISAAGFVGTNLGGLIESCFSTGYAYATPAYNRGASGFCHKNYEGGSIINCFAIGAATRITYDNKVEFSPGFLTADYDELNSVIINCNYNGDSIRTDNYYGGALALTTTQMQSQAFVDDLNKVASFLGLSQWEYRPGQYPMFTGVKADREFFAGGDGSKEHPYQIANKEQLENFRFLVNKGYSFKGKYLELTNDIDLNRPMSEWGQQMPENWEPIGKSVGVTNTGTTPHDYVFEGDFNGNFHEIRYLYADNPAYGQGLFGAVRRTHIRNLGVTEAYVTTVGFSGILAGSVNEVTYFDADGVKFIPSRITQCWTSGQVSAGYASAFVGRCKGQYARFTFKNGYSSAQVKGSSQDRAILGNTNYGSFANVYFTGTLTQKRPWESYRNFAIGLYNFNGDSVFYNVDSVPDDSWSGPCTTAYMQSREFVNQLNRYVSKSNASETVQLRYWQYNEGGYPTLTDQIPPLEVTFHSNEGSAVPTQKILDNSMALVPAKPVKNGFVFRGWYADETFTKVFIFDTTHIRKNTDIYARWEAPIKPDYAIFSNSFTNTYTITTREQLAGLAAAVNGIDGVLQARDFEGKTIVLANDILVCDTTEWEWWDKYVFMPAWVPIGQKQSHPFKGTFDGQGHVVRGIYFSNPENSTSDDIGGLVGYLKNGTVKNLGVEKVHWNANANHQQGRNGALVGICDDGIISQCYARQVRLRQPHSDYYIGGLVGNNISGSIQNCLAIAEISGPGVLGGLVVFNINTKATIENSYAASSFKVENSSRSPGGVAYYNGDNSSVIRCYYDSVISGSSANANGASPRTTALMKNYKTYREWDFDSIWVRNDAVNNGYPFLRVFLKEPVENAPDILADTVYVTSVSVKTTITPPGNYTINRGDTVRLIATVKPDNADFKDLVWTSSDTAIAKVDSTGLVTANSVRGGQIEIRATAVDRMRVYGALTYKIAGDAATGIRVSANGEEIADNSTLRVPLGESLQLETEVFPQTADQTITWTVSNNGTGSAQKISYENGLIKPLRTYTNNDAPTLTAQAYGSSYKVRMKVYTYDPAAPSAIEILPTMDTTLCVGDTLQLTAKVLPETAVYDELVWETSSTLISVSADGLIKALAAGRPRSNNVTVKCNKGGSTVLSASAKISVEVCETPQPEKHTLSVLVAEDAGCEGCSVSGAGEYAEGEEVQISATAGEGYRFVEWDDEAEEKTDNPRTIIMPDYDITYTARFEAEGTVEPTKYTLTVVSDNTEQGTVSEGGEYEEGATVQISATANEGYKFVRWNDDNTDNPRTITMPGRDVTYTAYFEEDGTVEPTKYTLTVVSDNTEQGTVSEGGEYEEGATVQISATAFEGYHFARWNDDNTDNPRTITMPGRNITYIAYFEQDSTVDPTMYTITVLSNNDAWGSVTGGGMYAEGSSAVLTAIPADGYRFSKWSDGGEDNPYTITVTANATYMALFEKVDDGPNVANETEGLADVKVYPNPSDGRFMVEVGYGVTAEIYAAGGLKIGLYEWKTAGKHEIDLRGRASGVYYLRLITGDATRTVKLVVK